MLTKTLATACLGLTLTLGACSDDAVDDDADGGSDAGRGVLQSGTYTTSNLQAVDAGDGCDLDLASAIMEDGGVFSTHELANTGTVLQLGRRYGNEVDAGFTWVPPGHTLGEGPYTTPTTATLTLDTQQTFLDDNCSHRLVRTSNITYKSNNTLSVVLTHTESNFSAQCNAALYPTTGCTSHYTFDLTKPVE